jgi:hypothetical protein
MTEGSSFIRLPKREAAHETYGLALDLAAAVHQVLKHATDTRIYLRDRLDRQASSIVQVLAHAEWDVAMNRWRYDRRALPTAIDCLASIDLLAAQQAVPPIYLDVARSAARRLCKTLAGRVG